MEQQRTRTAVMRTKVSRTSHPMRFERRAVASGRYAAFGLCTVLAIFAAGCTVGPRYGKPVIAVQPFHNAPSIESRQAVLPAPQLDTWWTGFDDPELIKIVERVLKSESRSCRIFHPSGTSSGGCERGRCKAETLRFSYCTIQLISTVVG